MVAAINSWDVLRALLRAPLSDVVCKRQEFGAGWRTRDEVIVSHRFLILEEGVIDYTVEGRTVRLQGSGQFFVPAWCRREWRVPAGAGACRMTWAEFSSGDVAVPPVLCWRPLAAVRMELAVHARLRAAAGDARAVALQREGELKAALARFWAEAEPVGEASRESGAAHPAVTRALAWLETHYTEPEALETFYRTVELSPNHFRQLFRRQTGETVQAVLARLRLRRARYLVQATGRPMKQIAAECGFADPLYFSGQYRKFWGRAATADRAGGGVA